MAKQRPLYHIEKIAEFLKTADIPAVYRETAVHLGTLYNIRKGKLGVNYRTVVALSEYMDKQKSNGRAK